MLFSLLNVISWWFYAVTYCIICVVDEAVYWGAKLSRHIRYLLFISTLLYVSPQLATFVIWNVMPYSVSIILLLGKHRDIGHRSWNKFGLGWDMLPIYIIINMVFHKIYHMIFVISLVGCWLVICWQLNTVCIL